MPLLSYPRYEISITSITQSTADGYDSAKGMIVVRKGGSLWLAVSLLTANFHIVKRLSANVKQETDASATINDADTQLYAFGDNLGYVFASGYNDGFGDENSLSHFGLRYVDIGLGNGGISGNGYSISSTTPVAAGLYCLNTKIATPSLSITRNDELNGFQAIPTAEVIITPNPVAYQDEAPSYWLLKIDIDGFGVSYQKIPYSLRSFRLRLSSGIILYSVIGLSDGTTSGGSLISAFPVLPTSYTVLLSYSPGGNDSDASPETEINNVVGAPSVTVKNGPVAFWGTVSNAGVANVSVDGVYASINYAQNGQFSITSFGKNIKVKSSNLGGGLTEDFEESNTVNCSSLKAGTPTIAWTAPGILGITYGVGSSSSSVSIGGASVPASSSIDLSAYASDGVTLPVKAVANADGSITGDVSGVCYLYNQNSDESASVSLQGIKLGRPSISYSSSKFSWLAVSGATSYDVYVNGVFRINTTALEYDPAETTGTGYVVAKGTNTFTSSLSVIYDDSDPSESLGSGILDTPVATVSSNVISWSSIPNADSYSIFQEIGGTYSEIGSTASLSYSITGSEEGTFNYKIQAVSKTPSLDSSALSSPVSMIFSRLQKPLLSVSPDGKTIYVSPESGAYPTVTIKISLNNRLLTTSGEPVSTDGARVSGRNEAVARAFSDDPLTLSSPSSSILYFIVENVGTVYKAYINGVGYGVGYPISLNFTFDETLETGTIILDLEDTKAIREPFEAFQRIALISYDGNGVEKVRWCFDIESDQVTEKQFGTSGEFLHTITVIGLSKELQTTVMPDLSITQPLDVVQRQYAVADKNNYGRWFLWDFQQDGIWSLPIALHGYWLFIGQDESGNTYSSVNSGDMRKSLEYGKTVLLPDWAISSLIWRNTEQSYVNPFTEFFHPMKRWFVRGRLSTDSVWTRAEILARINNPSSWQASFALTASSDDPISAQYFNIPATGSSEVYDVYLYVDPIMKDINALGSVYATVNLTGLYEQNVDSNHHYVDSDDVFLVSWNFSTVAANVLPNAVTIGKALDRIVGAVKPQRVNKGIIQNPKYSWYLSLHATEIADEETWSGGKTLWEMLSDLGRQFGGIPRLNPDNSITFDILGETKTGNPFFVEPNVVIQGNSDMDNHASALVTQAKNITTIDQWETWPYEGGWAAPKASDHSAAYVTRGNMAIRLPRDIDQIYSVEAKDMGHNGEETIIYKQGTNVKRCLEKTIWSLLPEADDSSSGYYSKSGCLTYSRGSDSIENLGALTATTETETIFGLSSGQYVISNIISKIKGYASASEIDPSRLLFRVVYKPYVDETITVEQPDQSEERAHSVLAFNQDGNTLSDSRLGKVMEDKVSRLGNNSFQRTSKTLGIENIPMIGQSAIVGDSVYYADKINVLIDCNFIEASVSYTKNKNNIDPRVGVSSEYRQYEIYADNFVRRQVNCDVYCVISKSVYSGDSVVEANSAYGMPKALWYFFSGTPMKRPTAFYVRSSSAVLKAVLRNVPIKVQSITKYDGSTASASLLSDVDYSVEKESKIAYTLFSGDVASIGYGAVLHADFRAIGNSVTFHAESVDNYSFGVCATGEETALDPLAWDWLGTGKYIQRDVRYVDDQGRCDLISFALGIPDPNLIYSSADSNALEKRARKYPMAEWTLSPNDKMNSVLMNAQYYVNKDNREALSFQYACHFLSFDSTIKTRSALASRLFSETSDISFVLLKKDPMSKEILSDSDFEAVQSTVTSTRSRNSVSINPGTSSVTPVADCWGYAYVIDSRVPLIEVKEHMASGVAHSLSGLCLTVVDTLPEWRNE